MAKQKKKKTKKIVYWVLMVVLLVAAAVVTYLVWDNYFNDKKNEAETSEATEEAEKQMDDENKGEDSTDIELKSEAPEKKKVVQYDGDDPNEAQELSGAITYAAVSGANFMVRVNIDQYVASGSCELVLKRNGATIHSSRANLVGSASTSTCEGFDVPVSQLGGGPVEIIINLSADGKSGAIRGEARI